MPFPLLGLAAGIFGPPILDAVMGFLQPPPPPPPVQQPTTFNPPWAGDEDLTEEPSYGVAEDLPPAVLAAMAAGVRDEASLRVIAENYRYPGDDAQNGDPWEDKPTDWFSVLAQAAEEGRTIEVEIPATGNQPIQTLVSSGAGWIPKYGVLVQGFYAASDLGGFSLGRVTSVNGANQVMVRDAGSPTFRLAAARDLDEREKEAARKSGATYS